MADSEACRICNRITSIPQVVRNNIHPNCKPRQDMQHDVELFHSKFGISIKITPEIPDMSVQVRRIRLIKEETNELLTAIGNQDIVEVADGIADAIYVILGTAIEYGIDARPIWDEVQRTNMAKEGGGVREDGKILKPDGWIPPDIGSLLVAQGWIQ